MKGTMTAEQREMIESYIAECSRHVNEMARLCNAEEVAGPEPVEDRTGREFGINSTHRDAKVALYQALDGLVDHYTKVRDEADKAKAAKATPKPVP